MARDLLAYLNNNSTAENPTNAQGRDLFAYLDSQNTTAPEQSGVGAVSANLYNYSPSQYDFGGIQPYELPNVDDIRANNQSNLNALARSTANLIGKTGVNVVGGTIGTIYGIGDALATGEISGLWDNALTTSLDAVSKAIGDTFKVYKSADYEDKSLLGRLFTHPVQFTDEFMDTLSFTTGAIVTELLTAGIASASVAPRAMKYLRSLDKGSKAADVGSSLMGAAGIGRLGNAANLTRQLATGAAWEASVEARHGAIELKDKMYADAFNEYGVQDKNQLPENVVNDIEDRASNAGLFTFLTNMALVGSSNMIQFPKIFGAGYNTTKRAANASSRVAREAGEYVDTALATTRSGRIGRNLATALKNPFMEGVVEEGGQSVLSNTANMYWDRANDENSQDEVSQFLNAFGKSLKDTYTTGEGWYEIGMGMLIGSLGAPGRGLVPGQRGVDPETGKRRELWTGGIAGSFQQRNQEDAEIANLVAKLNSSPDLMGAMKANYDFLVTANSIQKDQDRALDANDPFSFQNTRDDMLHSYIDSRIKSGMISDLQDQVEGLRRLSADDFYTSFRGEEAALQTNDQDKQRFKVNSIQELQDRIDNTIEATNIVDTAYEGTNEAIRTELIYNVASAKNLDIREKELNDTISRLSEGYLNNRLLRESESDIQVNVSEYIKNLEESAREETSMLEKEELNRVKSTLSKIDKNTKLAPDEFAALSTFIQEKPVSSLIYADTISQLLEDSHKIKNRRRTFINLYNTLFTKEGQEEFEKFQNQIREEQELLIQEQEAAQAKKEKDKEVKKNQKNIKEKAAKVKKTNVADAPMTDDDIAKFFNDVDAQHAAEERIIEPPEPPSSVTGVTIPQEQESVPTEPEIAPISSTNIVEYKGNQYEINEDGTITNLKTGRNIKPESAVGKNVLASQNTNQEEVSEPVSPINVDEQIADIERRREEEVRLAAREVHETGQYLGKQYRSWLNATDEVNAKYDAELAALQSPTVEETLTPEENAVVNIIETEERLNTIKINNDDGNVVNDNNSQVKRKTLVQDSGVQRKVGNTIISLNINYNEVTEDGIRYINDVVVEGEQSIVSNFDSRLQDPNQFNTGTEVNIIFPTYQQIQEKGIEGTYTEEQYNRDLNNFETLPIAFTDNNNRIIGYLPTTNNVKNRVDISVRDNEIINNQRLRQILWDNRNKAFKTKITRKSTGTPLFSKTHKSIYNALGDGKSLSQGVKIAVFKNNNLMSGLNTAASEKIKLPLNITPAMYFQEGGVYTLVPTADGTQYFAIDARVQQAGTQVGDTIVHMLRLFRAREDSAAHTQLIAERNKLAREIDLSNYQQLITAVENMIYVNNNTDNHIFEISKGKLRLGVTKDKVFNLDDIMTSEDVRRQVAYIIAGKYNAVRLAQFGSNFNTFRLNNGQLQQKRYRSYNDYLNDQSIITTNLQGQPIEDTNKLYFTSQSVIEFSDPIVNQEVEPVVEQQPLRAAAAPEPKGKPKSRLGAKPKINKTVPDIQKDSDEIFNLDINLDQQALDLMNKCK